LKREGNALSMRGDFGLRLYTKNVLIQEHNKDLLSNHLRFVEGVVDSEDLPLNISRETVQSDPLLRRIRKAINGRLIRALSELGNEDPDKYRLFWEEFGMYIKEGVAVDHASRDDLIPLLRFYSSSEGETLTTLDQYIVRMGEDQQAIYYILGEDRASIARSPHLDYFKAHELEVLYLVDPLDGYMMQSLREYAGKSMQNVDDAGLELPADAEVAEGEEIAQPDFDRLVEQFKVVLGERVLDVRASKLLKDSPCRLVSPEATPDRDLQRLRRLIEQDYEIPAKILEINQGHGLIRDLSALLQGRDDDPRIAQVIEQLFENLLLLEGLHPNPAQMVPRLQSLLEAAVK
jgi:molecular chaperone HtpG